MNTLRLLLASLLLPPVVSAQSLVWAKEAPMPLLDNVSQGFDLSAFPDGSSISVGRATTVVFGPGESGEQTLTSTRSYFVARFNPDGTLRWAKNGGSGHFAQAVAAVPHPDNSCSVLGVVISGSNALVGTTAISPASAFLARYEANGSVRYAKRAAFPAVFMDRPSMARMSDNSVAATIIGPVANVGMLICPDDPSPIFVGVPPPYRYPVTTVRYSATGKALWARAVYVYSGAFPRQVAVLPDDSIVVAIYLPTIDFVKLGPEATAPEISFATGPYPNTVYVRYDKDGNRLNHWVVRGGASCAVVATPTGEILTNGVGLGSTTIGGKTLTQEGGYLAKFESDGTLVWVKQVLGIRIGAAQDCGLDLLGDRPIFLGHPTLYTLALTFGPGEANETVLATRNAFLAQFEPDGTFRSVRVLDQGVAGGGGGSKGTHGLATVGSKTILTSGGFDGPTVFGPGEPNATTFSSTRAMFLARWGELDEIGVKVPDGIVQECDSSASTATVHFIVTVTGSPPAGATLVVTDETGSRQLLSVPAAAGDFGVGPVAFPIGVSTVRASVMSGTETLATDTFGITVEDTTAPVLTGCGPKTIECQGPLSLLSKSLLGISATDDCDPNPTISFAPEQLGLGTHTVCVKASDATGNTTKCDIAVTVKDTTPPIFVVAPDDFERECVDGGATISFEIRAEDLCGPVTLTCTDQTNRAIDPAGTRFSDGTHTITCVARDGAGNEARHVFTITVFDNTKPTLIVPDDITVGNDLGRCGARVWFIVTATDNCDPEVEITCTAPWGEVESGHEFPVGTTLVECTAIDKSNNEAKASFQITVEDREPPKIAAPATATLVTDCQGSPLTVSAQALGVSATDNCDLTVPVLCTPTDLSPGTTTVTCTATDTAGNRSTANVEVTVLKGPFDCQFLRPLDGNVDNRIRIGRVIPVKLKVACENEAVTDATATIESVERLGGDGTPVANEVVDSPGLTADNTNVMRFAEEGFYIYNLATRGWETTSGTRFRLTVKVEKDGHVVTRCPVILVAR